MVLIIKKGVASDPASGDRPATWGCPRVKLPSGLCPLCYKPRLPPSRLPLPAPVLSACLSLSTPPIQADPCPLAHPLPVFSAIASAGHSTGDWEEWRTGHLGHTEAHMQLRGPFLGPQLCGLFVPCSGIPGWEGLPVCTLGPLGEEQEKGRCLLTGLWLPRALPSAAWVAGPRA